MSKNKTIILDCGIEAEIWKYIDTEWLSISLIDFYEGCGKLNDLQLLSNLLNELSSKGYKGEGLSRIVGYYESTDDILLRVTKKIK